MDEVIRLSMKDLRVQGVQAFRELEDAQKRAERERFEAALDATSKQAWFHALVVGAASELGIAWLIMRKRGLQYRVAAMLRRMAKAVEPRRVR